MNNQEIAHLLKKVAAAYIIKEENRFKIVAYERAADTIEHATSEIKDLWDEEKLSTIPGIGPSIASHLDELFRTGKVKHFEKVFKGVPAAMFPLLKIPGLGPKKAYKLVTALKLRNPKSVIKDLKQAANLGKIAIITQFGQKSQAEILESIKAYERGASKEKRMLLPFASNIASEAIEYLKKYPEVQRVDSLGSLRRKVVTIGDIDLAVATKKGEKVIDWFLKYPKKRKLIEKGPSGATIILDNNCQVDLRVQKPESYGSMLQYFTGSKHHNIHLRELAIKKGLSLSEHGIKVTRGIKKGKLVKCPTEEKFYQALDLPWIPPELREDMGEIEAAQKDQLPFLLKDGDIKGDVHIHSNFQLEPSHDLGKDSIEDLLIKAKQLQYQYIGFSEHNPKNKGLSKQKILSLIKEKKYKIEKLLFSTKFTRTTKIFNMLEIDILPDGNLALPNEAFEYLDAAIASIHSSFKQNRKEITNRVLKALKHPKIKILGHPTGRLLQKREEFELDWIKIFEFCRQNNKALEINARPERLDLPDTLVRKARSNGVKMIICTDAHQVDEMDLMKYGVSVARRGWAEKGDILNTLPYNKFKKWLLS